MGKKKSLSRIFKPLYSNLGRQAYILRENKLLSISDKSIEIFFKNAIINQKEFNVDTFLYFIDFLKNVPKRYNEILDFFSAIDREYLNQPNKMKRKSLYVKGFRYYLDAHISFKSLGKKEISNLESIKAKLSMAESSFIQLLERHTLDFESRTEDYKNKLQYIKELKGNIHALVRVPTNLL